MNYKRLHRNNIINQYLSTRRKKNTIAVNENYIELKKFLINNLPYNKYKIIMNDNRYDYIMFYGYTNENILIQYMKSKLYICNTLWSEIIKICVNKEIIIDIISRIYKINIIHLDDINSFHKLYNFKKIK